MSKTKSYIFSKKKFQTADQLEEFHKLKSGCSSIDTLLQGGFRTHILNEIVGCSGSGKTQICLLLSLMVQLPKYLGGFNKVAVYVCTEDVFPIKRLHELNYWFCKKYQMCDVLDNVFINHVPDYEKLKVLLNVHIPNLAKVKQIGLVIIDSIAGIFRSDNLGISYSNRSKQFTEIAVKLREIAAKYNAVIICVNQVTDDANTGQTEACLGLSWTNLINTRLFISRSHPSPSRLIQYASELENNNCTFFITEKGLSDTLQ